MRSLIALLMFACAIVAAAAVSPAAPAQDRVPYPGLMTQGKIWIQNTGRAESGSDMVKDEQRRVIGLLLQHGATAADTHANGKSVEAAATSDWIRELLR